MPKAKAEAGKAADAIAPLQSIRPMHTIAMAHASRPGRVGKPVPAGPRERARGAKSARDARKTAKNGRAQQKSPVRESMQVAAVRGNRLGYRSADPGA